LTQVKGAVADRVHAGRVDKPLLRMLQGLALSAGGPAGWLLLQALGGADPALELAERPGVYLYMLFGTALAFGAFGWYVGTQEQRYRERSLHDALTGLYNSRYFWERLEDECAFALRHDRPLALLIGDLDLFKNVNDNWGHAAGDRVLAAVAAALMQARRRGDTVARVGGEEFAVILPETALAEALAAAERLREAVGALRFEFGRPSARHVAITLSVGAAVSTTAQPLTAGSLYERADAAMYRAKQAGRDRVTAAGEPGPTAVSA
jgi:diguanylate cyclase (GGDEF)-like protein